MIEQERATSIEVGILHAKDNGVPVYVATDADGGVWRDEHPTGGIDAAYFGEDKYDMAERLGERPEGVEWFDIELLDAGGVWYARYADDWGYGQMGDMPGEAAMHLEFTAEEEFEAVTDETDLDSQLEEVLESGVASVYEAQLVRWLLHVPLLETVPSTADVEARLYDLANSTESLVEETQKHGEFYSEKYTDDPWR